MSFTWNRIVACLIALTIGGVALPAVAQEGDKSEEGAKGEKEEEKVDPYAELQRANKLASYNAWTRSIPHYKKVIEAAPRQFPIAVFNLAEVYRVKEECGPAVLYFEAYLRVGNDDGAKRDAKKAIERCKRGEETATLAVTATPEDVSTIKIGGAIFSENSKLEGLELLAGEYDIEASAADHISQSKTVTLSEGDEKNVDVDLVHKTYYGSLKVAVDQEGAAVEVEPLELDAPKSDSEKSELAFELTSPMNEAEKLPTGKYSVVVNKDEFDRWIRYVRVERDEQTTVDVEMVESLPSEIR